MAADNDRLDDALLGAQRGLLMRAVFGQALTLYLKNKGQETCTTIVGIITEMSKNIVDNYPGSGLVAAFSPELWSTWQDRSIPISTENIDRFKKFTLKQGDVLIFVKSPSHKVAEAIVGSVYQRLEELSEIEEVKMGKRKDTRIMGGRYVDGITNPNDPISLAEDILID